VGLRVRRILGRDRQLGRPGLRLVSAGALLEIVTLPENALVPPAGAEITTQEDTDTLELIGGAEEEFEEAVLGANVESRQWGCGVL
jgi:hypothetical protein